MRFFALSGFFWTFWLAVGLAENLAFGRIL